MGSTTNNLGLALLGSEDRFDITVINSAFNGLDGAVFDVLKGRYAWNFLDNSDFREPVNQRGGTRYSGSGYTIDRWKGSNSYSKVTIGSKYVNFEASGGMAYPRQLVTFTEAMWGKTYTAAVCTNAGNVTTVSANITADAVTSETTLASATIATGTTLRITKMSNGLISVRFDIADGSSLPLRWAALYEGGFTKDTLPEYRPKGYAAELLECQRYCYRLGQYTVYPSAVVSANAVQTGITVPTVMRVVPTIESGTLLVLSKAGSTQEGFTFTVSIRSGNRIRIAATKNGHGQTNAVLRADTDVILSADL